MTREQVVALAESLDWKPWGKLRRYQRTWYQCFRRRNEYCWIGWWYVERSGYGHAEDFVSERKPNTVKELLT